MALEPLPTGESRLCTDSDLTGIYDLRQASVKPRSVAARVMYKNIRMELDLDDLCQPYSYQIPAFEVVGPLVALEKEQLSTGSAEGQDLRSTGSRPRNMWLTLMQ